MITVENFVNKSVNFYFEGRNLHFKLSQSLFSSFDIDQGSKLLLKIITKSIDLSKVKTLLDIGTGIGVLGITIKSLNPNIKTFSQDRDALAVEFTGFNAIENSIKDIYPFGSLALDFPDGIESLFLQNTRFPPRFDLLVSNLPAKAGEPVLRHVIKTAPLYNTSDGLCAFVIVKPLQELFKDEISKNNFEIITQHSTKKHSVFIYRDKTNKSSDTIPANDALKPYFRSTIKLEKNTSLDTVYGIKNFDAIDFETQLTLSLLKEKPLPGKILIWNPYQGYIPVHIITGNKNKHSSITIASRDYLSLLITAHNMRKIGYPKSKINLIHHSFFDHKFYKLNNFNSAIISLDRDTGIDYSSEILEIVNDSHLNNKALIVTGTSHQIARLKKSIMGKNILKTKKNRGHSGIFIWFTH